MAPEGGEWDAVEGDDFFWPGGMLGRPGQVRSQLYWRAATWGEDQAKSICGITRRMCV